jgi:acyl dehydratase
VSTEVDSLVTDEMRACIGRTSPIRTLPEEISASDVRRYVEAIGDQNPLWTDDELARSVGYRGRRVPPILVRELRWRIDEQEVAEGDTWTGLVLPPNFTSTRNAGQEVEWLAPVYIGDRLAYQTRLTDVFGRQGRNGPIIFTKRETEIRNQHGVPVARVTGTSAKMAASQYPPTPAEEG